MRQTQARLELRSALASDDRDYPPGRLAGVKRGPDSATAADLHLSDEDLGEIDAILADALPVWGPHPEGM
jgi:hypothetical protein